eukprot:scaffold22001_cov62-Phaeocystis_antarctica.AAC.2
MRWRYATAAATEAAAKEAAAKKATAEQANAQKEARLLEAARGRSVCPGRRQELWRRDGANRRWLRICTKEMGRWGHPSSETSACRKRTAAQVRGTHRSSAQRPSSAHRPPAHWTSAVPDTHRPSAHRPSAHRPSTHRATSAHRTTKVAAAHLPHLPPSAHRATTKAAAAAKAAHRAATKAAAAKPTHRRVARWLRRAALVASAA